MSDEPLWSTRTNQFATACVAVLGIATTALGVFTSYQSIENENVTREAAAQAEARREISERFDKDREFSVTVFDKAYAALESDRPRQQQAALALVESLPLGALRSNLIAAFARAGTAMVASAAAETAVEETEFEQGRGENTEVLASRTEGFDVDVFWCSGDDKSEQRRSIARLVALDLAKLSNEQTRFGGTTLGRVRLRPLPPSVNVSQSFRINSNVVLFNPGQLRDAAEEPLAAALAARASALSGKPVSASGEAGDAGAVTKWYSSVFFCDAG